MGASGHRDPVLRRWALTALVSLAISACGLQQRDRIIMEETRRVEAKSRARETAEASSRGGEASSPRGDLEKGLAAFQRGDYRKASRIFEAVRQRGADESLRDQALYALACTRLILARDTEAFKEGLALWERWRRTSGGAMTVEDPVMMTPLHKRLAGLLQVEEEVQRLRPLKGTEKEIRRLRRLQAQQEEEIKRLRHQLEGLENIHRSIKEKEKEVTF